MKLILVPVATIGCGKTTTSLVLKHILGDLMELVSNDDISRGKKANEIFIQRSLEKLHSEKCVCVVLDRNNHMIRERQQILDDVEKFRKEILGDEEEIEYICLNFIHGNPRRAKDLWELTTKRVLERGDNHQSIKASTDGETFVKKIMGGFVSRFQQLNLSAIPDSNFSHVIDLEVSENSSLINSQIILQNLKHLYPQFLFPTPTNDQWNTAFEEAIEFRPIFSKNMKPNSQPKQEISPKKPLYPNVLQMLKQSKMEN